MLSNDRKIVMVSGIHAAPIQQLIENGKLNQFQRHICILAQHGEEHGKLRVSLSVQMPKHSIFRCLEKLLRERHIYFDAVIRFREKSCHSILIVFSVFPDHNGSALFGGISVHHIKNVVEGVLTLQVGNCNAVSAGTNTPVQELVPLFKGGNGGNMGILCENERLLPERIFVQSGLGTQKLKIFNGIRTVLELFCYQFGKLHLSTIIQSLPPWLRELITQRLRILPCCG